MILGVQPSTSRTARDCVRRTRGPTPNCRRRHTRGSGLGRVRPFPGSVVRRSSRRRPGGRRSDAGRDSRGADEAQGPSLGRAKSAIPVEPARASQSSWSSTHRDSLLRPRDGHAVHANPTKGCLIQTSAGVRGKRAAADDRFALPPARSRSRGRGHEYIGLGELRGARVIYSSADLRRATTRLPRLAPEPVRRRPRLPLLPRRRPTGPAARRAVPERGVSARVTRLTSGASTSTSTPGR